jgi:hypothetical protein
LSDSISVPKSPAAVDIQETVALQLAPPANEEPQLFVWAQFVVLLPDMAKLVMLRVSALVLVSVVVLDDVFPTLK